MTNQYSNFFTRKMFFRQFVPATFSAFWLAFSDMADAIVVGNNMGVDGLAAISLALPVFMFISILISGFGVGGSIQWANLMAQGKKDKALSGFQGVAVICAITSVLISICGNLFLPQLLNILGTTAADGAVFEICMSYVRIIISGAPIFFANFILNAYLRNNDMEVLATVGFVSGNLCDIVLNFVFVLFLNYGAAGAAMATICGQSLAVIIYLVGMIKQKSVFLTKTFNPDFKAALKSIKIGAASSSQYIFNMCFLLIANNMLVRISGHVGVAVFDMVQNISFLIFYLYEGSVNAAQPILSTFCGEHNSIGKAKTLSLALKYGSLTGIVAIAFVAVFPNLICALFGINEASVIALGSYALRMLCVGAVFAGLNIILSGYYQATNNEKIALLITTLRTAAILIPTTIILANFGINAFWLLYPITEILTLIIFTILRKIWGVKKETIGSSRVFLKSIENTHEELGSLIKEIIEFCEGFNASMKQVTFVTMAVEELCAIIMQKGFTKQKGYIQITVIAEENDTFTLHIRDSATSFNPFSLKTGKATNTDTFDMDTMGVLLVKKNAKNFSYRRYQGFNTLVVTI